MKILDTVQKEILNVNIRHRLFSAYVIIVGLLGLVFGVVHILNQRPMVNIMTSFVVTFLSVVWYLFSRNEKNYTLARITFIAFFSFIYVPFGYLTSPGSYSAMPTLVILTVFMISALAVRKWEYLFPGIIIIELVLLLLSEIYFPAHYINYTDSRGRIYDLIINISIVNISIVLTLYYMLKRLGQHQKALYDISVTDSLTGLYNKRYFDEFVEMEYSRYLRTEDPFSVIFIDLDNFKRINDTHGHMTGDRVLKDIAQIIVDNIRNYDVCARYGGDEFIIALPSTTINVAQEMANRLENGFKEYSLQYSNIGFDVSYGVADSTDKNLEEIFELSDNLLYKRKAANKDNHPADQYQEQE